MTPSICEALLGKDCPRLSGDPHISSDGRSHYYPHFADREQVHPVQHLAQRIIIMISKAGAHKPGSLVTNDNCSVY